MADGQQARDVVERRAEVIAVADFRGTGVQCHPDANRAPTARPGLGLQRLLRGKRRVNARPAPW